jgi:hypothetical protein
MKHAFLALALLAACSREPSVAEKSAAAYRDAQAKGTPVGGGHDHGAPAASTATTVDHSTMDHSAHTTMDHSAHGASTAATTVNHSTHRGATAATVDHSAHRASTAATVDHSAHRAGTPAPPDPHAGHTTPTSGETAAPPAVPRTNSEIQRIDPASTLKPDAFDAPRAATPRGAVLYSCPMHPEVTSDKPGTCPKCGMALVKKD